jgi:hypothetical protein
MVSNSPTTYLPLTSGKNTEVNVLPCGNGFCHFQPVCADSSNDSVISEKNAKMKGKECFIVNFILIGGKLKKLCFQCRVQCKNIESYSINQFLPLLEFDSLLDCEMKSWFHGFFTTEALRTLRITESQDK